MSSDAPPLILHVIHHLRMGGMENGLVNLINRMPADRFRHAIACVEDYSDFRARIERPDVAVHALHRSTIGVWGLRRELYRLCRQLQPAIVHSRALSGLDAILPATLAGVPVRVHSEHGWDTNDLGGVRAKPALLRRLHAPFVTRYVSVSKDIERYLVQRVGIAQHRVEQICNGVDTVRFAPAAQKPATLLPASFREPGVVVFGSVGRCQPVKDQATLLRAFARLREREPTLAVAARLAIVGDGPLHGELQTVATSLGIAADCWLPGACDDVPNLLRSFDVFALPSLAEGISNTVLEALATGLPVIATAVGGNTELVEEGVTGALVRPGDIEGLVAQMAAFLQDPDRRRRQGQAARQAAVTRFGLQTMVNRYQALYEGLVWSVRK